MPNPYSDLILGISCFYLLAELQHILRQRKDLILARKYFAVSFINLKPEDHCFCIAHLSGVDMLESAVIEEKKLNNIESDWI